MGFDNFAIAWAFVKTIVTFDSKADRKKNKLSKKITEKKVHWNFINRNKIYELRDVLQWSAGGRRKKNQRHENFVHFSFTAERTKPFCADLSWVFNEHNGTRVFFAVKKSKQKHSQLQNNSLILLNSRCDMNQSAEHARKWNHCCRHCRHCHHRRYFVARLG